MNKKEITKVILCAVLAVTGHVACALSEEKLVDGIKAQISKKGN